MALISNLVFDPSGSIICHSRDSVTTSEPLLMTSLGEEGSLQGCLHQDVSAGVSQEGGFKARTSAVGRDYVMLCSGSMVTAWSPQMGTEGVQDCKRPVIQALFLVFMVRSPIVWNTDAAIFTWRASLSVTSMCSTLRFLGEPRDAAGVGIPLILALKKKKRKTGYTWAARWWYQ